MYKSSSTLRPLVLASITFSRFNSNLTGGALMGDKSPKANDKKKKQDAAGKSAKKAAPATKAPAPAPAKKGK